MKSFARELVLKQAQGDSEAAYPPREISGFLVQWKVPVMTIRDTWFLWSLIGR